MDDNISDRNHYCEDCMTEIEQFVRNYVGGVVNKAENMEKALNDALCKVRETNVPVLYTESELQPITAILREKDFKSEPRTGRYRIDYEKIMSLKESGMKNKDIATQMGMTPQEVATAVYLYKKRNGMETGRKEPKPQELETREVPYEKEKKVDIGKIRALHNAKWGVAAIAGEMGMKESEIIDILESVNNADAG